MTCVEPACRLCKEIVSEAGRSVSATLGGIMTRLSRLALFSTTALVLGGVSLGLLAAKVIDAGGGVLMGAAEATVAPATPSADFPICHTPAAVARTHTVLRLAQTRTEVPPTEMQ